MLCDIIDAETLNLSEDRKYEIDLFPHLRIDLKKNMFIPAWPVKRKTIKERR